MQSGKKKKMHQLLSELVKASLACARFRPSLLYLTSLSKEKGLKFTWSVKARSGVFGLPILFPDHIDNITWLEPSCFNNAANCNSLFYFFLFYILILMNFAFKIFFLLLYYNLLIVALGFISLLQHLLWPSVNLILLNGLVTYLGRTDTFDELL